MNIFVHRKWFTEHSTIGELRIKPKEDPTSLSEGVDVDILLSLAEFCFTLEPPKIPISYRDHPGVDPSIIYRCIPAGRYRLRRRPSVRFKMDVLEVMDVPGRSDIEIHFGNFGEPHSGANMWKPPDTEGCTCVGYERSRFTPDFIGSSRVALNALNGIVFPVLAAGEEVWITYVDAPVEDTAPIGKAPKVVEVEAAE